MLLPKGVPVAPDRRRRHRVRLAYPIRLQQPGDGLGLVTKTEDLSCEGFFCISEQAFSTHETIECELVITTDQPGETEHDMVLRFHAKVVRVVPQGPRGAFGVACRFEDYTIARQIGTRNEMGQCLI
jgi:PilZ domain